MQTVSQVMTRNVQFVSPQDTLRRAAQMMDELDIGALPVCDGDRLVGMITDRDIAVRATSAGMAPDKAEVNQVMSTDVRCCFEDQEIDEVMQQMADTQIRRVPVVSHDDEHRLIGIVSLGDIATKSDSTSRQLDDVMEDISFPSEPDLSRTGRDAFGVAKVTMASNTGTATGLAGSEVENAQMGVSPDSYSSADPSDTDKLNSEKVAAIDPSGPYAASPIQADTSSHRKQDDPILVRRTDHSRVATSTGESGAPAGTDVTGISGSTGGIAGTAGSAGSGVGAQS